MKMSRCLYIVIFWSLSMVNTFPRRNYHLQVPIEVNPIIPDIVKHSSDELEILRATEQDPEVRPGLFQGDIMMTNEVFNHWRVGLRWDRFPEKLWDNRTVPYVISPLYRKFGGGQVLSLQPTDERGPNCLGNEGRAVHELLHTLGIFHEQSRADRDTFVTIRQENILSNFLVNFDKQSLENTTYSYEYDYNSIMHYGSNYFSKNPHKPTIVPTMQGAVVGQRKALSKTDCLKVNELYGCLDNSFEARRWHNVCNILGL
ncbi:protein SpAN-like isoform X2 [Diachasmimorpha longicaudata]|uniref:protein SpAN-like isoform X2 n=1 Tax=Diachasmimorpha longicaudata TaxID=58733 RepID=UPI0030B8FC22